MRNILITINNPDDSDLLSLQSDRIQYSIYQVEKGKEGTVHIQGYVELKQASRLTGIKKLFPRAHIERRLGTQQQAIEYCSKEDTRIEGPFEYGTKRVSKVKSLSFREYFEKTLKPTPSLDMDSLFTKDSLNTVVHSSKIKEYIKLEFNRRQRQALRDEFKDAILRPWQEDLISKIEMKDKRKVYFVIDYKGNNGKSWLGKYLMATKHAVVLTNSKSSDIAYCYNGEPIVCFDFARSLEGRINYSIIEQLKNGLIFSPKYKSKAKIFYPPQVIIFMNFDPDRFALSDDRYELIYLSEPDERHSELF